MPRNFFSTGRIIFDMQRHIFNDASELALASVASFRITYTDSTEELKFIIGKARLDPLKILTIPTLELQKRQMGQTCAICQRAARHQNWKHNTVDSTIVYHWINSPNQRHQNGLNFILNWISQQDWWYVPSKDNSADDETRGYNACDMTADSRWIKGLALASKPSSDWSA